MPPTRAQSTDYQYHGPNAPQCPPMPPKPPKPAKKLLETSALIVGYAMSRLDRTYLTARGHKNWNEAFAATARLLKIPPASLKNLRDEFDPFHDNNRQGWHKRAMYPSRRRIMGQLCDISDAALLETIEGILAGRPEALEEVVAPLSKPTDRIYNVAERLRTGRLAETYFLENSRQIADLPSATILDHRNLARGYDFALENRPEIAIEIKGLKRARGGIAFTDREWTEAAARRADYWLVVVGNLEAANPVARLIPDPTAALSAQCRYQTTLAASWRATVGVA